MVKRLIIKANRRLTRIVDIRDCHGLQPQYMLTKAEVNPPMPTNNWGPKFILAVPVICQLKGMAMQAYMFAIVISDNRPGLLFSAMVSNSKMEMPMIGFLQYRGSITHSSFRSPR